MIAPYRATSDSNADSHASPVGPEEISQLEQLCAAIGAAAQLLPTSGPITSFAFLNTLQALEDMSFQEGMERGARAVRLPTVAFGRNLSSPDDQRSDRRRRPCHGALRKPGRAGRSDHRVVVYALRTPRGNAQAPAALGADRRTAVVYHRASLAAQIPRRCLARGPQAIARRNATVADERSRRNCADARSTG